jgi:hypothetical protein
MRVLSRTSAQSRSTDEFFFDFGLGRQIPAQFTYFDTGF